MEKEEILSQIGSVPWYHRFEILPGIFTPGKLFTDPKATFAHFGLPGNLEGKNVLEVGTWDGPLAFECEARGATVTALDIQNPNRTGFNVAKRILGSHVRYVQGSVYEAAHLLHEMYDYIFFLGVYYHLKNPVLAFEELSRILSDGAFLVFEGACIQSYAENAHGIPVSRESAQNIGCSEVPLAAFYANTYCGDDSNWFVPNFLCLKGWMEAVGLGVISHSFHSEQSDPRTQRVGGVAQKVAALRVEHRLVE